MEKQTFLQRFAPEVQRAVAGTGLFPSVKLAQMILETGWGDSIQTAENNCFGIKANSTWRGKVVSNSTHEVINGTRQFFRGTNRVYETMDAAKYDGAHQYTLFRVYNSIAESIADHSMLLITAKRYTAARQAKTPEEQATLIQEAGYATAPNYASTLIAIIKSNNLKKYDI